MMNYYPYPYQMYNQFRLSSTDELNEGLYKWVKLTFTNGTEKEAFVFYLDKPSGAVFILSFPALTTSQVNVNNIKSVEVLPKPPKMEEEEAPQEEEGQTEEEEQEQPQEEEQEQPETPQMPGMDQEGGMQSGQESPFGQMPGMDQGGSMQSGQGSPFGQMPGVDQGGGMQSGQGNPFGQMPGMDQGGGMQSGQGSPFGQMPGSIDQSGMPFGGQRYQQWNQPVYYNPYSNYWQS
ncbi:hypothetical protein [Metabacillus idriensis]|uniref:hypothetical protein n=1 Tax=Metabacillus idriensis TaxID=324768 RepID=UPI003D2E2B60